MVGVFQNNDSSVIIENGGDSGDEASMESDSSLKDVAVHPITIQPVDEEADLEPIFVSQ